MNAPERTFKVTGGDGHFESSGRGVWVGHLLAIPFPGVPSVGGSSTFETIRSRLAVGRSHRLRGVHFGTGSISTSHPGQDPVADVYRHLPVPPSPIVSLASPASPGNVNAGPHGYAVVFKNGNGKTTPSPIVFVMVEDEDVNGKVRVKVPLGPEGTTNREVYRTPSNGADLLLLVDLDDNTTEDYLDDTADSELGPDAPQENTATVSVLEEPVILSSPFRSLVDQPLRGELASDPAIVHDPCLYTLRTRTSIGEGGEIEDLEAWLEIEFIPADAPILLPDPEIPEWTDPEAT